MPIALTFALISSAGPVFAWGGQVTGKIARIDVTDASANYSFRVFLAGGPALCAGGPGWAYVNLGDSNYQAYVSTLTSAYLTGKSVEIFSDLNGAGCKIGYIAVSG